MFDNPEYDSGIILHALGGLLLGILVLLMYFFRMQDVWPFTLLFSLAFPLRELSQHDWNPRRLLKGSIALEAFPAFFIVWACDLIGRFHWGVVS